MNFVTSTVMVLPVFVEQSCLWLRDTEFFGRLYRDPQLMQLPYPGTLGGLGPLVGVFTIIPENAEQPLVAKNFDLLIGDDSLKGRRDRIDHSLGCILRQCESKELTDGDLGHVRDTAQPRRESCLDPENRNSRPRPSPEDEVFLP